MTLAIDFLNELADRLGKAQITTLDKPTSQLLPEHRKLLRLTNRVLNAIGGYNDWPMLRETAMIRTVAAVKGDSDNNDFVTATQDSATITLANAAMDETFIGRAFQVDGDEYIYRIKAIPSPTTIALNRAWVNDSITIADEKTYIIAMDRYTLPADYGRPVDNIQGFFAPYNIDPVVPNNLKDRRGNRRDILLDDPEVYTIYGLQSGRQILHLDPFPKNARLLEYEYQKNHPKINSDQDEILYPISYIPILLDAVQYLAERDYKESPKMDIVLRDFLKGHNIQQSNTGPADSRFLIRPENSMRQSMQAAFGTSGYPIDWGDIFETGAKNGF